MATYLETVNRVATRLRVGTFSSVNESNQSRLIGRLVNDAKREVEGAHDWTDLTERLDDTVNAGDTIAAFSGTTKRTRILHVFNATEEQRMYKRPRSWIIRRQEYGNYTANIPTFWALNGYTTGGQIQLLFFPDAGGTYTITADCLNPQASLTPGTDDATEITVPDDPVYLRALAMALEERGDDGGTSYQAIMQDYAVALAEAAGRDAEMAAVGEDSDDWFVPCR